MRAWLLVCAALALAPGRATAAASESARLERIKSQILAKLGLTSRPTPQGAPPHDVVRQILARAADPAPRPEPHDQQAMREIIAIAHRDLLNMKNVLHFVCNSDIVSTVFMKASSAGLADNGSANFRQQILNSFSSLMKIFGIDQDLLHLSSIQQCTANLSSKT